MNSHKCARFSVDEPLDNNNSPPQETNDSEENIIGDLVMSVHFLKERLRRLERAQVVSRRKSVSVAVAGDDEETVLDGSCSGRCMKYFVDLISITGLKEIYRAKHPMVKALWAVTLIISIVITGFYLFTTVNEFFHEPTATKVKIHRQDNYSYPVLLLCPDTWLHYDKALKLGATRGAIQYALGYLINYYFRSPSRNITNYTQAKSDFELWYTQRNYTSLVEMFKDIAVDSEEFFYKCPNCESKSFTKVLMDETICYRIAMENMTGKGTARSATEILEVKVADLSDGLLHRKKYWRLYVNPDITIGMSTVRFVQVFPGFSNTVRFTPTRYLSLDTPDDPCKPMDAEPGYSTIACALECAHEKKNCTSLGSMRQTSKEYKLDDICHYYPQYYWYRYRSIVRDQKLIDRIPEDCFEECQPLCERWLYETSVEAHKISSYALSNTSGDSIPVPITRIYFLNQAPLQGGYILFREVKTYGSDTMIGNIGGIMGLWLGASLMSLIQIVVFLITWCFARYLNWRAEMTRLDSEMTSGYPSNGDIIL